MNNSFILKNHLLFGNCFLQEPKPMNRFNVTFDPCIAFPAQFAY